jgi:hypothetical protein
MSASPPTLDVRSSSEEEADVGSPWPRRLLIIGTASLVLGTIWMFSVMPDMSEQMHPENNNLIVLSPGESASVDLVGSHIYAAYQKVNSTSDIDGEVLLVGPEGEKVSSEQPSLWVGVGRIEFDDGSVFEPLVWWQVDSSGNFTFESNSNQTTWVVDQNAASAAALGDPGFVGACFTLVLGTCLLPLSLIIRWANRRSAASSSQPLLLQTPDGREVPMGFDPASTGIKPGQAVLTTDQIYQLARIREQLGPDTTMEVQFKPLQTEPDEQTVAPPFADRPDGAESSSVQHLQADEVDSPPEVKSEPDVDAAETDAWKRWDKG